MKKIISILLIAILLLVSGIPAFSESIPSQKEEVVYGILDTDGSIDNLYVVNVFSGGSVTDYGSYTEIRNMTTSDKLQRDGDQITAATDTDRFCYQGTLERRELPWDFDIKYHIDGKEMTGAELAGKSGLLKIDMSVRRNKSISRTFFENYALQITFTLDNRLCSNIRADNATIAEAAGKKQLTYTVLPGSGTDISVTADVRDFEMEPVTVNGIKMSLDIAIDTVDFTGQISELKDAIEELDDGAGELAGGVGQLADGMQEYAKGLKAFKDGIGLLTSGAGEMEGGASALSYGLSELTKQNDTLMYGAAAIQQATFDTVNGKLSEMGLELPVLTPENYSAVLSAVPSLAAVKNQLDGAIGFTQGLKEYTQGVAQLGKGASELTNGVSEFNASSSVIAQSANELYSAAVELNGAVSELRNGLNAYWDGTKKFKDGTSDIDSKIDKQIDEVLGSISGNGDKTVSFVSEKNTHVASVQFVLKTSQISKAEAEKPVAAKPVKLTFWQRLLKLFGLYK